MQSVFSLRNTYQCKSILSCGARRTSSRVPNHLQERKITRYILQKRGAVLRQSVSSGEGHLYESHSSSNRSKVIGRSDAGSKTGSDFTAKDLLNSKDGLKSDVTSARIHDNPVLSTKSEQRASKSCNPPLQQSSDGSDGNPPRVSPQQESLPDTANLHDISKQSMRILKVTSFMEALNALRFGDIELLDPASILAGWHHHNLNRPIQLSPRLLLSHDSFDLLLIYVTLRPVIRALKSHNKPHAVLDSVSVTYCGLSEAGQSLVQLAKAHSIRSHRMIISIPRKIVYMGSEPQENVAHQILLRYAHDEAKTSDQSLKKMLYTKFPSLPVASMYNLGTLEPGIHIMQGALRAGSEASLFLEALDFAIYHRQALHNTYTPVAALKDFSRPSQIRLQETMRIRNDIALRDLTNIRTWLSNYTLAMEQPTSNRTSETSPAIALATHQPAVDVKNNGDATQSSKGEEKISMQTRIEFNVLPKGLRITISEGFIDEDVFTQWVESIPSDLQTKYIRKVSDFCRTLMAGVAKQDQSQNHVRSSSAQHSKQLKLLRLVTNLNIVTKYGRAIETTNTRSTPHQFKLPAHLLPFCRGKLFPVKVKFATRSLPDHEKALVAFECIRVLEVHLSRGMTPTGWSRIHISAIRTRIQQFTEWLHSIEEGKDLLVAASEPERPPNRFTGNSYESVDMEINAVRTWYLEVEEEFKTFEARLATMIPEDPEYKTMVYERNTLSLVLHAAAQYIRRSEFKARSKRKEPIGKLQLPFVPPVVPYDVLHYLFGDLLYQIQHAVFAFGRRDFPDFMQRKGWLFPENVSVGALNDIFTRNMSTRAYWALFKPELDSLRTIRNVHAHHETQIDVTQLKHMLEDSHIVALLVDSNLAAHIKQHQFLLAKFEKKVAVVREIWRRSCESALKSIESGYSKAHHASVTKGKTLRQRRAEARTTKFTSEERNDKIASIRDRWKEEDRNKTIACSSELKTALLQKRIMSMLDSLPTNVAKQMLRSMNNAYYKKGSSELSPAAEQHSTRSLDPTRNKSGAYVTQHMPGDSKTVYPKPMSTYLNEGLAKEVPSYHHLDPSFDFLQAEVLAGTDTSSTVVDDTGVSLPQRRRHVEETSESHNPVRQKSSGYPSTISPAASNTYDVQKIGKKEVCETRTRYPPTEVGPFIRKIYQERVVDKVKPGLTKRIASRRPKNLLSDQAFQSRGRTRNHHHATPKRKV